MLCRFVRIFRKYVPATEDDVVQIRERNQLIHFLESIFRALTQPDLSHLRVRPDGLRYAAFDRFNSRVKSGGHGAHSRSEDGKFAFRGRNLKWLIG